MSNRKRRIIIAVVAVLVAVFTVWNIADFCSAGRHSTASYLAVIFNLYAVIETARLIVKGVKRRG